MFTKVSLKVKLIGLCIFLATLTAVAGAVGCFTLSNVIKQYNRITSDTLPNILALTGLRAAQKDVAIVMTSINRTHVTVDELKKAKDSVADSFKKFHELAKEYESLPFDDGEEAIWLEARKSFDQFESHTNRMLELSAGSKADEDTRDQLFVKEYAQSRKDFLVPLGKIIDGERSQAQQRSKKSADDGEEGIIVLISLASGSFIFAALFGYFFSSSIARSLNGIAEQLATGGREVSSASQQISESSSKLAASSTEQASALQETVASIDEISAMVSKNADNAKRSQETASVSHQAASKGKQSVQQMISSIDDISKSNADIMQQVNASNQDIANIVKIISEIGNKTKVINDIVFQTKLLSFNASVEAARAGEHGKGFAVVAEEVGNLAQMSGNAAKEISQMLEDSIQKVESTVNNTKLKVEALMQTGKQKVEFGTVTAQRCGEALDEIEEHVKNLTLMVNEIATASQEQSQGVQEITKAMGQLDQVTQENNAASQQAASAGEELNGQALALHGSVAQLLKLVQGTDEAEIANTTMAVQSANIAASKAASTVLAFKRKTEPKSSFRSRTLPQSSSQKIASGSDVLPSENDPRFKDV